MTPEFVTFHSDRPSGIPGVHPNANLLAREYMGMVDMLCRSARLFHPAAPCTLLTDANTDASGLRGGVKRVDNPIDHASLMLSRTQAQADYVRASSFKRPMAIVDSDMLINHTLSPVFKQDFDVALTWRADERMPINGGLILLNNRRPEKARAFFERFAGLYRECYAQDAAWYGDQLALRDLVGLPNEAYGQQSIVEAGGVKILLLPCETHNFSPRNRFAAILTPLREKVILHFKGERKRLMRPFWDVHLKPRENLLGRVSLAWLRARLELRNRVLSESDEPDREASAQ